MPYKIETRRLVLAPFEDADIDRRVALANDIEIARMVTSMPHPYTRKDAMEWVTKHDAGRAAGTDFPFAISLKGEGLVGAIGLHKKDGPEFELGYWIGKPYWGRGIASEAAKAVMQWASQKQGITEIVACYFEDNPASGRVLGKIGFSHTGTEGSCHSIGRGEKARSLNMIWQDRTDKPF